MRRLHDRLNRPAACARWPHASALVLGIAVLAAGCGASGHAGSTPASPASTATSQATTAQHAALDGELVRLRAELPPVTAPIPARWTSPAVDRAYLTALFDDAQTVWRRAFEESHLTYKRARLMLFWGKVESGCGRQEDSGPFYCPADSTVYLDLRFFADLIRQSGPAGTAQAFIVGHEVGHHIQRLLGIADRVAKANEADPQKENARSVQVELQSDCLAGVWGSSAYRRSRLTKADLSQALRAAQVIGDDYIQQAAGVVVDSAEWTHGSSQQRQYWLSVGFNTGRPSACNTFAG